MIKLGKASNCLNAKQSCFCLKRVKFDELLFSQAANNSKSWVIIPSTIAVAAKNKELSPAKRRVKLKRESAMSFNI